MGQELQIFWDPLSVSKQLTLCQTRRGQGAAPPTRHLEQRLKLASCTASPAAKGAQVGLLLHFGGRGKQRDVRGVHLPSEPSPHTQVLHSLPWPW